MPVSLKNFSIIFVPCDSEGRAHELPPAKVAGVGPAIEVCGDGMRETRWSREGLILLDPSTELMLAASSFEISPSKVMLDEGP